MLAITATSGGGRGARGGVEGALTRDKAAVKLPGDDGKAEQLKARSGGELRHERGGKEAVWGAAR
jgi:hypothetical protein